MTSSDLLPCMYQQPHQQMVAHFQPQKYPFLIHSPSQVLSKAFSHPQQPSIDLILYKPLSPLPPFSFFSAKSFSSISMEAHLSKMIKDMESLAKAEKALQDMQDKLVVQEQVIKKVKVEIAPPVSQAGSPSTFLKSF